MDIVDYTEFERFYWKNYDLDGKEICLRFLDRYDDKYTNEIKEEIKNS